nr:MAG TPA: hypothetical protein [Crassvirales sp.]
MFIYHILFTSQLNYFLSFFCCARNQIFFRFLVCGIY